MILSLFDEISKAFTDFKTFFLLETWFWSFKIVNSSKSDQNFKVWRQILFGAKIVLPKTFQIDNRNEKTSLTWSNNKLSKKWSLNKAWRSFNEQFQQFNWSFAHFYRHNKTRFRTKLVVRATITEAMFVIIVNNCHFSAKQYTMLVFPFSFHSTCFEWIADGT